jgi:hypothetical protein
VSITRLLRLEFLWLAILLTFAGQNGALAVSMRPMSLEELIKKAQLVVHGKVLSKTVQRDIDGQIITRIELEVIETVKGGLTDARFFIVQSGGVLGDEFTTVSGQEHYEVGEEVVAFLVFNQRGEGVTLGLAQGKFHVEEDKDIKERVARNPFLGRATKNGKGLLKLDELKQRVKGVRP